MIKKILFAGIIVLFMANAAFAKINAVATLPWIGSLLDEIGKDKVKVKVLVKPSQDPHYVEARPSMILAVRRADALFYNGLDLEVAYLPVLIESSRNAKIQPGMPGHIDCSQFIEVIDRSYKVDRSMGDVHPYGNPHYHLSVKNIVKAAQGITDVLSAADPGNAEYFKDRLADFTGRMSKKESEWRNVDFNGMKVIAYHKQYEYLAKEFNFSIAGYIEPKPGIPPSASHIQSVINTINDFGIKTILTTAYYGVREAKFISEKTGARVLVLPHDVRSMDGADDLIGLIDTSINKFQ
ncbi:zinc ABC transporter substrate-binding protein [bacterium]|nr:zinc ABC transporter substrate-binding protein [bacterium]